MPGDLDVRGDEPPPAGDVPLWCEQCGRALTEGDHRACAARRALEPPRYCGQCRRRMVVQVLPRGWSARCVEHGTLTG